MAGDIRTRARLEGHPHLRNMLVNGARAWWILTFQLVDRMKARRRFARDRQAIAGSPLFDPASYLAQYPDVAPSGVDPASHYVMYGGEERRNPGPSFDADWYLNRHTDVAESGANPFYTTFALALSSEGKLSRFPPQVGTKRAAILPRKFQDWALMR